MQRLKSPMTEVLFSGFAIGAGLALCGCESDKSGRGGSPPATSQPTTTMSSGQQTVCPVSDYNIDPNVWVEHQGRRVYLCCDGCKDAFQKYPERFVTKLPQFGGKEAVSKGEMPR